MAIGGLIGGIISLIAESQANAQRMELERQDLNFRKSQAARQDKLATAPRTDAYGNETGFDELLNKWFSHLTPTQSSIVKGGEREQLASLNEDAPQAREMRNRQFKRSKGAEDTYNRLKSGFDYDLPPDQDALQGEITGLLAGARTGAGNTSKDIAATQAMRMGRGGDIAAIAKSIDKATSDAAATDALTARGQARSEAVAGEQAHEQKYLYPLKAFEQIMNDVGTSPPRFSETPNEVNNTQNSELQAMINAITSGTNSVGGALENMAGSIKSPNFDFLSNLDGLFGDATTDDGSGDGGGGGGGRRRSSGGYTSPLRRAAKVGVAPSFSGKMTDNDLYRLMDNINAGKF